MIPQATHFSEAPAHAGSTICNNLRRRAGLTYHTLDGHGGFVLPLLEAGMDMLHLGCGTGGLTRELAEAVLPGAVTGVDSDANTIRSASRLAEGREITNVEFICAEAGRLPFAAATFDLVFAPEFFECLGDVDEAIAEIRRVLRPGGIAAMCHRAWDRLDVEPFSLELAEAFNDFRALLDQAGNAADEGAPWIDKLHDAGFGILDIGVSFEDVESPKFLAEAFAGQLELAGNPRAATTLLHWADEPGCRMTQMWRHVIAIRVED